jgi:hypothetical protein
MSIINKLCVWCCCCQDACFASEIIDNWGACEASLLCCLDCNGACWTLCYPVVANFELGDTGKTKDQCISGLKNCILCCGLGCAAEIDPFINCILYSKKIFTDGVTGWKDVQENATVLGTMIRDALDKPWNKSGEPFVTFGKYTP